MSSSHVNIIQTDITAKTVPIRLHHTVDEVLDILARINVGYEKKSVRIRH